ncbi:MAG: hydrogenase nickel incorporation protein HypB [Ignavibacteriaceae bacterium]|nr:hydrogenase nickel incorporation protein HypB [Ignavibacteriaceae bacterium]
MSVITVERKVLEKNDTIAQQNREVFKKKNLFTMNLVSSPGSGKTSLIENTIHHTKNKFEIAVIEGDVQTSLDAERVAAYSVPVVQIVTHGACHLEAGLVRDAFRQIAKNDFEVLFIENVGNLVCPAGYDLGEDLKVVIVSTTEGDDKPLKYPAMFRNASALIINKIDLVPYVNCSLETLMKNALSINPSLKVFKTSCTTDEGIEEWCSWIESKIKR